MMPLTMQTKQSNSLRSNTFLVGLVLLVFLTVPKPSFSEEQVTPFARAKTWMEKQVIAQATGGSLILSFTNADGSVTAIYDQAVAIVAFTMLTDYERAASLIRGLMPLLEKDGSLKFTYDTNKPALHGQGMVRTGALSWVGYAVCFYLDVSQDKQDRDAFLAFAKRIAGYVMAQQIKKKGDVREGLVTGGDSTVILQYDASAKKVKEVFLPGRIKWCSVEHNVDSYFFLRLLEQLTGKKKYGKAATRIRRGLFAKCWDEKSGQFVRSVNLEEGPDKVLALDSASWGGLFAMSSEDFHKAHRCLDSAQKRYYVESGALRGHKTYSNKLVYENYLVGQSVYPKDPRKTWEQLKIIWPEGTLGVAALLLKMNRMPEAEELWKAMEKLQDPTGGIIYSSEMVLYEFGMNLSVACTGWYIMDIMMARDQKLLKKFWQ